MSVRDQLTADICVAHAAQDAAATAQQRLIAHLDRLTAERALVAETLATFYAAPLSLSSVQPVLDLAVRLNPTLWGKPSPSKRELILS